MRRLLGVAASLILGTAMTPVSSFAQCTANGPGGNCATAGSASMTAGRVVQLQMSTASTLLTAPTSSDFDAGFNSTAGPMLTVSANAAWTLHIRASTATWTGTTTSTGAPARANKPAGDLKWALASTGPFAALTTTDAPLVNGAATAGNATSIYFRTLYDWTLDTPGNYSLSIVLTLTAP